MLNREKSVPAAETDPAAAPAQPEADLELVLEEYRRRQMVEHLAGPVASVALHLAVLALCFVFMVSTPPRTLPPPEFRIVNLPIKPVPEKVEPTPLTDDRTSTLVDPSAISDPGNPAGTDNPGPADNPISDYDDSMQTTPSDRDMESVMLDVKLSKSPLRLPGAYINRIGGEKDGDGKGPRQGTPFGPPRTPPEETKRIVSSLQWLKEHQNPDGSWSEAFPRAMCGLALLAYLGNGELQNSKKFGPTVEKAMRYLAAEMNSATERGTWIRDPGSRHCEGAYSHAIATYALAEAYGMTQSPLLREPMEKGLEQIIKGQNPSGGWDYGYKQGARWDISLSGWHIQALKAGFIAGSANSGKIAEALAKAQSYLLKTAYDGNKFAYAPGGHFSPHMQGVGALCLQLLGQQNSKEVQDTIKWVDKNVAAKWNDPNRGAADLGVQFDPYGWYYHTQMMYYNGGDLWKRWKPAFFRELSRGQCSDGHWDAPRTSTGACNTAGYGDLEKYYATTLCCLMLEVEKRYLPSASHMDLAKAKDTVVKPLELE